MMRTPAICMSVSSHKLAALNFLPHKNRRLTRKDRGYSINCAHWSDVGHKERDGWREGGREREREDNRHTLHFNGRRTDFKIVNVSLTNGIHKLSQNLEVGLKKINSKPNP